MVGMVPRDGGYSSGSSMTTLPSIISNRAISAVPMRGPTLTSGLRPRLSSLTRFETTLIRSGGSLMISDACSTRSLLIGWSFPWATLGVPPGSPGAAKSMMLFGSTVWLVSVVGARCLCRARPVEPLALAEPAEKSRGNVTGVTFHPVLCPQVRRRCCYFSRSRLFPVISAGCSTPSIPNRVGAISARIPSSISKFSASSAT